MNTITLNHFSPPITDLGHYLKTEQGEIFLAGTRVGLWQIVQAYESGSSPEQIVLDFPALSLTQIYAAITYYLVNREILSLDADAPDYRVEAELFSKADALAFHACVALGQDPACFRGVRVLINHDFLLDHSVGPVTRLYGLGLQIPVVL